MTRMVKRLSKETVENSRVEVMRQQNWKEGYARIKGVQVRLAAWLLPSSPVLFQYGLPWRGEWKDGGKKGADGVDYGCSWQGEEVKGEAKEKKEKRERKA